MLIVALAVEVVEGRHDGARVAIVTVHGGVLGHVVVPGFAGGLWQIVTSLAPRCACRPPLVRAVTNRRSDPNHEEPDSPRPTLSDGVVTVCAR
jgi:hypothetical protein